MKKLYIISEADIAKKAIGQSEDCYIMYVSEDYKKITVKRTDLKLIENDSNCDEYTNSYLECSFRIQKFLLNNNFDVVVFEDIGLAYVTIQSKETTQLFDNLSIFQLNSNSLNDLEIGKISKGYLFRKHFIDYSLCFIRNFHFKNQCLIKRNHHDLIYEMYDGYKQIQNDGEYLDELILSERYKVSVCVSHYNYADYIEDTVNSIENSSYKNIEIIIADDESDELSLQTLDLISEKHKNLKVYKKKHGGAGETKNYAAKRATGEFLLFIDGDDILDKDAIKKYLYAILKSQADWVNSYFWNFKGNGMPDDKNCTNLVIIPGQIKTIQRFENVFGACNFIIKRDAFFAVDGFPIRENIYDDWNLFLKLSTYGYRQAIIPIPLFYYRRKNIGVSHTVDRIKTYDNTVDFLIINQNIENQEIFEMISNIEKVEF